MQCYKMSPNILSRSSNEVNYAHCETSIHFKSFMSSAQLLQADQKAKDITLQVLHTA